MNRVDRIVLIGLSGTGKTAVGRALAARLGWRLVDTDAAIERSVGLTIPEIFRRHGEAEFRTAERQALRAALSCPHAVVACGGGAATEDSAWSDALLGGRGTLVVALDATPEASLERLLTQRAREGHGSERPLLAVADPLQRIAAMKAERQPAYDRADITLIVDRVTAEEVAAEIASLPGVREPAAEPELRLVAPSGSSEMTIRPQSRFDLGRMLQTRWPRSDGIWMILDDNVERRHGEPLRQTLSGEVRRIDAITVPPGEGSKRLEEVGRLYDVLLEGGIERGDVVVAVGGGVIGDLAGFVAATCLRGVGLAQVPTTLLAMVDSSVGGKTGINHRSGKNLIGAFYQPSIVVIDPAFLATLPERELRCGWAEIVKHALIQPSTPAGERGDLAAFLRRNAARLTALEEPATTYLIRRNVALKAAVVEADEREAGIRAFLNLGHTIGHAIEAAGYRLLHGEAVALGLRAAARIGAAVGSCGEDEVGHIDELLDAFGLPRSADLDLDRVVALLSSDKKRAKGRLRWILPVSGGGVTVGDDVPAEVVRSAISAVSQEGAQA